MSADRDPASDVPDKPTSLRMSWGEPARPDTARRHNADAYTSLAVASDETWVAAARSDGTVRIWELPTGRHRATLAGHIDMVTDVAIAPDGTWLATASLDGTIRLWDAATGEQRGVINDQTGRVTAVAITSDGKLIVSGGRGGMLRLWDATTGDECAVIRCHDGWVTAVAVAIDGSWLATAGSDRTVRTWWLTSLQARATLAGHLDVVTDVVISRDGQWLATGSRDSTVRLWDVATGRQRAVMEGHAGWVNAVAIAVDGEWLVSAGSDGTVREWSSDAPGLPNPRGRHIGSVTDVVSVGNCGSLVTCGLDGTVRVWRASAAPRRYLNLTGHTDAITGIAVARDGGCLATSGRDGTVRLWDAATGLQKTVIEVHPGWATSVAISSDGTRLTSTGSDGVTRTWDVTTARSATQEEYRYHSRAVTSDGASANRATIAEHGQWVAAVEDDTVTIRNSLTGSDVVSACVAAGPLQAVCWAPDGRSVFAGGQNGLYRFDLDLSDSDDSEDKSTTAGSHPAENSRPRVDSGRRTAKRTRAHYDELVRLPFGNGVNPNRTFEAFVIGSSNRFAHAAAVAVAESPANAYNPLFIYGGSGLGVTDLLHAIANYALALGTIRRPILVSTEQFTNEFINSLRDDTQSAFQRRYRDDIDMLLIADIQFLENRERTQEEFFHTFNTLHNANKQIVITSDRKPKDLATLEDRLRTRFEWGLLADITPPDLETRIAILQKKQAQERLHVPKEVLEFIASRITKSIRELEGALLRVTAFASLNRSTIDLGLAEEVLRDFIPDGTAPELTVEQIMEAVSEYFGVSVDDLRGQSRSRVLVNARQVAMYLCRELTDMSLPRIGHAFGGRDHTMVMHADRKIRQLMPEQPALFNQITELLRALGVRR